MDLDEMEIGESAAGDEIPDGDWYLDVIDFDGLTIEKYVVYCPECAPDTVPERSYGDDMTFDSKLRSAAQDGDESSARMKSWDAHDDTWGEGTQYVFEGAWVDASAIVEEVQHAPHRLIGEMIQSKDSLYVFVIEVKESVAGFAFAHEAGYDV